MYESSDKTLFNDTVGIYAFLKLTLNDVVTEVHSKFDVKLFSCCNQFS